MDGRPFSLRQDVESETPARTSEPRGGESLKKGAARGLSLRRRDGRRARGEGAARRLRPRTSANARPTGEPLSEAKNTAQNAPASLTPQPPPKRKTKRRPTAPASSASVGGLPGKAFRIPSCSSADRTTPGRHGRGHRGSGGRRPASERSPPWEPASP